jgi:hypothetical protein
MNKNELKKKYSFDFDEQGTNEVSEQIMDSYHSGYIDQGKVLADRENLTGTRG